MLDGGKATHGCGFVYHTTASSTFFAITQPKLTDLDTPFWSALMPLYVSQLRPGSTSAQPRSGCTATIQAIPNELSPLIKYQNYAKVVR
jgi:hypothetical protein